MNAWTAKSRCDRRRRASLPETASSSWFEPITSIMGSDQKIRPSAKRSDRLTLAVRPISFNAEREFADPPLHTLLRYRLLRLEPRRNPNTQHYDGVGPDVGFEPPATGSNPS